MSNVEALKRAFALQAQWGESLGSPFTSALMRAALRDLDEGEAVLGVCGDWQGEPIADAVAMRFGGALQAATLLGKDAALAAEYPAARADWSMERIWPLARAFLVREREWVRDFFRSPPQTNETRRTIAMLPAFLELATHGPLHTIELGASAGLNAMWDRFRYETESWSWGAPSGARIDTVWRGPPPAHLDVTPVIASRSACDRNPLDVGNDEHVLRLRAFVWADQAERRARLKRAIAQARSAHIHVDRAEAGAWLAERLAQPLPEGVTVIYHSVAQQYFDAATNAAIDAAIAEAAARADSANRLARIRYEVNALIGIDGPFDGMAVDLETWPGGERRVVVRTDGHATFVDSNLK